VGESIPESGNIPYQIAREALARVEVGSSILCGDVSRVVDIFGSAVSIVVVVAAGVVQRLAVGINGMSGPSLVKCLEMENAARSEFARPIERP